MLELALVFGESMVLQREKPVCIWGKGIPGQKVNVQIQGKSIETKVKNDGNWNCTLEPLSASEEEMLQVSSGEEYICYHDVAVGDVWLAGGQSNMEFAMFSDREFGVELKDCDNPCIRFFDYPKVAYDEQLTELPHKTEGFWRRCNAENLKYYSAVAYYFAKKLQVSEQIPVGIIGCNWEGTPACSWVDGSYCKGSAAQIWWDEYEECVKSMDMKAYEKAVKEDFNTIHSDWIETPYAQFFCMDATYEALKQAIDASGDYELLIGPKSPSRPSGLYKTMLKNVVPYTIKGFLFYQGESDEPKAQVYGVLLKCLIQNWRDLWKENLPFLFVQLAPYEGYGRTSGINFPMIRSQQQWVEENVENTAMAVISDAGDQWNIHPRSKRAPGERLALLALSKVYQRSVLCDSPVLCEGWEENGEIVLKFLNAGEGLILKGNSIEALDIQIDEREVTGYKYQIERDEIHIQTDVPVVQGCVKIEFAQQPYHKVNLYNSAGLPARPKTIYF